MELVAFIGGEGEFLGLVKKREETKEGRNEEKRWVAIGPVTLNWRF